MKRESTYSNYHTVVIHHGRGHKNRVLSVPNALLKMVQRRLLERYLYQLIVSEYSTAYCKVKSPLDNVSPHVGKECVLKLDISHFFDSIDADMVYVIMKQFGFSDPATALLTNRCVHNCKLPQGTPTSSYLANLVMKHFDEKLGEWCSVRRIDYTRYCDDMTFSGTKKAVKTSHIIGRVKRMFHRMGFELNERKTLLINSSQQQRVTGIVVNEKSQLSRNMRRSIRQEVYYCTRYAVKESLTKKGLDTSEQEFLRSLLGRISFAMQANQQNKDMRRYFKAVKNLMHK